MAIWAVALLFSGCASDFRELTDARTGLAIPANFTGTVRKVEHRKEFAPPAVLRRVDTANCAGFERVVFQFDGVQTPGYRVEYIDKPVRQCASGQVITVAGDAWLEVRMIPAQAHDAGGGTVANRNRMLNYPNLRQLVETCDFEGHETWVLGVGFPGGFRVTELTNPPRLVVDVRRTR